jgi:hypothetical protein
MGYHFSSGAICGFGRINGRAALLGALIILGRHLSSTGKNCAVLAYLEVAAILGFLFVVPAADFLALCVHGWA